MYAQRHRTSAHQPYLRLARSQPLALSDRAGDWLEDVAVVPAQFFDPPGSAYKVRGEVALLYAVLEDALKCFQQNAAADGRHARRLAREAKEWFLADDHRWPFSFVSICAVLGLDPEYIRLGLKRWSRGHPAGQRQTRRRMLVRRQIKLSA
jgi:hypothetical protein